MTSSTNTTVDYYRLLGISSDALPHEIRAAYRNKIRLWHPDIVAGKTEDVQRAATEMTARLIEAYECLSDPDRRSNYDISRHTGATSARRSSTTRLVVTPQTMRCEVTPGATVRLTLKIRADDPPGGDDPRVRASERLIVTNVTMTAHTAGSATLEVTLDTSRLDVGRTYHIPIEVTWAKVTGTATLVAHTTHPEADSAQRSSRGATSSSRRHRTRRSDHRVRNVTTITLGGVVLPLLVLAWASGLLQVPTPANQPMVAAICAVVVAATTWLLMSSRLLHQPGRLARIGVVWGHLMRWSGWIVVGGFAIAFGIPAIVLTLMAVVAAPLLGFVVIAFISGRVDSQNS